MYVTVPEKRTIWLHSICADLYLMTVTRDITTCADIVHVCT